LIWQTDNEPFSEEKFAAALNGWKHGARGLGTESTLSLLLLWIAATLGGMDTFLAALAVVALVVLVRHGYSKRISENFTEVLERGETSTCRVRFSENSRNGEPQAFLVNAISGDPIGRFRILVHDAQIEPLVASADREYELLSRYAYLDGKVYVLISTGKQIFCGISIK
jgi:hypothetical protein